MTVLIDANVLIALSTPAHLHHSAAVAWRDGLDEPYAICPITEGTLVRFAIRKEASAAQAVRLAEDLDTDPKHEFWPDNLPYRSVRMAGVVGHRQVTDTYLAELARRHQAEFATFDRGAAAQHADMAILLAEAA
ncbi:MAG: PIN domain-containing protein [Bifidobacteriaceae bacterium]|jgi:toxin-antitoxin system PIN domain toxin|nr:PIN domain-containing protein [Bifidobacteriaceae bacterium]